MMKNPFKLSLGLFLGILILMGAVRPGPTGGGSGNLSTIAGRLPVSKISATGTANSSTYLRGDGAWASAGEAWATQSQASNGNTLTLSGLSGALYEFEIYIVSNSATSVMDIAFNSSAGSYTYYQQYNGLATNGTAGPGYFAAGAVGSGSVSLITGRAFANGSIVGGHVMIGSTGLGMAQAIVYKTLAAATITAITINSNQANGIGAGSYIRARKIA